MSSWVRYGAAVYFGLMMAGSLARPGWGVSRATAGPPPQGVSAELAPLKQPHRYTEWEANTDERRRARTEPRTPVSEARPSPACQCGATTAPPVATGDRLYDGSVPRIRMWGWGF